MAGVNRALVVKAKAVVQAQLLGGLPSVLAVVSEGIHIDPARGIALRDRRDGRVVATGQKVRKVKDVYVVVRRSGQRRGTIADRRARAAGCGPRSLRAIEENVSARADQVELMHLGLAELASEVELVSALGPGQIVLELVTGDVTALREGIVSGADPIGGIPGQIPIAARSIAFRDQCEGNEALPYGRAIRVGEDGPVIAGREEELVSELRRESVSLVQLSFIGRLRALRGESWIEKAALRRLDAVIVLGVNKEVIFVGEIDVHAIVDQPFLGKVGGLAIEDPGVGIIGILGTRREVPRIVVVLEDLLVNRSLRGEAVVRKVAIWSVHAAWVIRAENIRLIVGAGSINGPDLRNNDADAFRIDEAVDLVFLERPAYRGRPLVGIVEVAR